MDVDECKAKLRAFNAAWARVQTDTPGWLADAADQAFDNALRNWLITHKAMLIGELVPECRKYLRGNPLCADRSAFDHVLVDEYQDLNRAEQEVLELLAEKGTFTIIGDDNQSIYSFKHAHPEGIVEFHQTHPATTSHSLSHTTCFASAAPTRRFSSTTSPTPWRMSGDKRAPSRRHFSRAGSAMFFGRFTKKS